MIFFSIFIWKISIISMHLEFINSTINSYGALNSRRSSGAVKNSHKIAILIETIYRIYIRTQLKEV